MRRVVITGVGIVSPVGNTLSAVGEAFCAGRGGVRLMPEWNAIEDMHTRLGAPAAPVELSSLPRKKVRTMGRVSLLAMRAAEDACRGACVDVGLLSSGRMGLAFGSTHGSSSEMERFTATLSKTGTLRGLAGSAYLKFMSHTCAGNLAAHFGIRGCVLPTVAACASGSQAVGCGIEQIRHGRQDAMLCGGAEELHFVHAAVFDIMYATSTHFHDHPARAPRPFDAQRDGLVVGEGAGALVLEAYDHARARGVRPLAELVGYATNCDGTHMTAPSREGMAEVMRLALRDARLAPGDIEYVNAHGTGTARGDLCESHATLAVLGDRVPFGSTKGFTGHTLGACGALEVAFCLLALRDGFLPPNHNLDHPDGDCAALNYIQGGPLRRRVDTVMTNNFAFGGINTSLILRRCDARF